jgi:hypothetical protein
MARPFMVATLFAALWFAAMVALAFPELMVF